MSDQSSAKIGAARRDWKAEHQALYLSSGGVEGHIVDVSDIGGHRLTPTLLLQYVGRKSGKTRITPLIYGVIGGEVVVVASKGGADHHPAWYLDLRERRELRFQIASQAYRATWREPKGAERARVWDYMVGVFPPYASYQASTTREIPLVTLSVQEPVEIFEA
ncbi:MAG TPA: nitroreductase/quinone reductase family protein [Myxococcota bacterium]|nr:nitroreductase/quinone reductase family protein [Myxococcota bacterium]